MPPLDSRSAQPDQLEATALCEPAIASAGKTTAPVESAERHAYYKALASLHQQARAGKYVFTSDPVIDPDPGFDGVRLTVEVSTTRELGARRPA